MFILIDVNNKIIGTVNNKLDSKYLEEVKLRIFEIDPKEFNINMIGNIIQNFEVCNE